MYVFAYAICLCIYISTVLKQAMIHHAILKKIKCKLVFEYIMPLYIFIYASKTRLHNYPRNKLLVRWLHP